MYCMDKEAALLSVHVLYSELMLSMTNDNGHKGWSERQKMELKYCIAQFNCPFLRKSRDCSNFGI